MDNIQKYEPDIIAHEPHGRYMNPLTDFGFKRIFGTEANKDLLIDFLNAVLTINDKIVNLTYSNVERKGRIKSERGAFFDLHCITNKGERIIVEMQNIPQTNFKDRALYYVASPIHEQGEKKKRWNFKLQPVYSVNILNFAFKDKKDDDFIHQVQLMDVRTKSLFYEKLIFVFIELEDFNKPEDQLTHESEQWTYLLKYLSDLKTIPESMKKNKVYKKLFEQAELANMNKKELSMYDKSLKRYRDMYTTKTILRDYISENKKAKKDVEKALKDKEAWKEKAIMREREKTSLQHEKEEWQHKYEELRRLLDLKNISLN